MENSDGPFRMSNLKFQIANRRSEICNSERSEDKPRVLMVTGCYYPEISGGGLQCRTLAWALRARVRFTVLTTTRDPGLPSFSFVDGIPVYRLRVDPARLWSKLRAAADLLRLAPPLLRESDVVHSHGFTQKMLLLTLLAKLLGTRIVEKMSSLGLDDPLSIRARRFGRLLFWSFGRADTFISVSPALSERFVKSSLAKDRLVFIPNGVDTDRFRPAGIRERAALKVEAGFAPATSLVTFVGFWSRDKGPDILLEAWLRARRTVGVESALLFIGATDSGHVEVDARLVAQMRERLRSENLNGAVRLVQQTHEVPRYLRASDIFVLPTLREGLPNALVEAMATGLACVSTDLPGVTRWLIRDGENGLLIPPGDVTALERYLVSLLNDEARASLLGARARETVLKLCSIRAVADSYWGVYQKLLKGGPVDEHEPYGSSQQCKNPGRREGGGCEAERGIAPERTGIVREDASPKLQRSKRPLSADQG